MSLQDMVTRDDPTSDGRVFCYMEFEHALARHLEELKYPDTALKRLVARLNRAAGFHFTAHLAHVGNQLTIRNPPATIRSLMTGSET